LEKPVSRIFKYTFTLILACTDLITIDLTSLSERFEPHIKKPKQQDIPKVKEGGVELFFAKSMARTFHQRNYHGKSIDTITL
jgi:hypothetical protein